MRYITNLPGQLGDTNFAAPGTGPPARDELRFLCVPGPSAGIVGKSIAKRMPRAAATLGFRQSAAAALLITPQSAASVRRLERRATWRRDWVASGVRLPSSLPSRPSWLAHRRPCVLRECRPVVASCSGLLSRALVDSKRKRLRVFLFSCERLVIGMLSA